MSTGRKEVGQWGRTLVDASACKHGLFDCGPCSLQDGISVPHFTVAGRGKVGRLVGKRAARTKGRAR